MPVTARSRLKFFRGFAARPRQVGAVMPSGRNLAAAMVEGLPLTAAGSVVEFGPGTGPFTRALLDARPAGHRYLGVELSRHFVNHLRGRFPSADAAEFVHGSAADAWQLHAERGLPPAEAVICGLPFASLPHKVQDGVVTAIDRLLEGGGTFRTFQYVHAFNMANARRFRARMDALFGPGECAARVIKNVPPACVMSWTRPAGG